MDKTLRNLDENTYRELKARAALTGRTVGELVNEAMQAYLARPLPGGEQGALRDFAPEDYPDGCERLSEEIDQWVYGVAR